MRFSGLLILLLFGLNIAAQNNEKIKVKFFTPVDSLKGAQIGMTNIAHHLQGLQLGVISNVSTQPMKAIQISPVSNVAHGVELGIQASIFNVNAGYLRGMQAGIYNHTDTLTGFQIGLINHIDSNKKGMQLGLLNKSGDTIGKRIGLVNVTPKTQIQFFMGGGNYDKFTFGIKFLNRSTYNVLGMGAFHTGLGTERYSASMFYRIGQYWDISPRWRLSGDVGFAHIETFREKDALSPERLYSLQARVNIDYQVTPALGVFATGGYGQTRWYNRNRKWRDKPIFEAGLTYNFRPYLEDTHLTRSQYVSKYAEEFHQLHGDSAEAMRDAIFAFNRPDYYKKHPWLAAFETAGLNVLVNRADLYLLNYDYADVNFSSWGRNLRNGFVWDNDFFSTNQFAHPYHGNLYFNSARSNGMNFWQSYCYSLGGSLMWEFFGEKDPPAINDVFSTSMGGAAIGEVLHRASNLVLDDSKRGWPRFWRELTAGVIDPMRALNRIIRGDAWKVRGKHYLYHDYHRIPVEASLAIGDRYVADAGSFSRGSNNLLIGFHLEYGDAFAEEHTRPYDYFSADIKINVGSQPMVSDLHLMGRLYGHTFHDSKDLKAQWGIFQHFDYYASDSIKGSPMKNPYEISQTAAFGPGLIVRIPVDGNLSRLEQRTFLNGILLGGSKSDYYNFLDRDYNIGSGYGIKSNTRIDFGRALNFFLNIEYFRLFTWKGYEKKDYQYSEFDAHFLNAQGDKSNARLFVMNPRMEIYVKNGWRLLLNASFYRRSSHYTYFADKQSRTYEVSLGGVYHF